MKQWLSLKVMFLISSCCMHSCGLTVKKVMVGYHPYPGIYASGTWDFGRKHQKKKREKQQVLVIQSLDTLGKSK